MDRLEPAFILSRRPYSNSSLLIELFTPRHGRMPVIAKGARSSAGKKGGHLQPFMSLDTAWIGRGEIKTLTKAEACGQLLLGQGQSLYFGFYLNELLTRLVARHDPCELIFQLYADTLKALQDGVESEAKLRRFEVELLELLGYGMQLNASIRGEPIEPGLSYHYRLEQGPEPALAGDPVGVSGDTLLALAGERPFSQEHIEQARSLMRRVMRHYLGERPLKSRELFRSLYAGRKG